MAAGDVGGEAEGEGSPVTAAAQPLPKVRFSPLPEPATRLFTSSQILAGALLGNPVCGALMVWMNLRAFDRRGGTTLFLTTLFAMMLWAVLDMYRLVDEHWLVGLGVPLYLASALGFAIWSGRSFDTYIKIRMHRRRFRDVFNAWFVSVILSITVGAIALGVMSQLGGFAFPGVSQEGAVGYRTVYATPRVAITYDSSLTEEDAITVGQALVHAGILHSDGEEQGAEVMRDDQSTLIRLTWEGLEEPEKAEWSSWSCPGFVDTQIPS